MNVLDAVVQDYLKTDVPEFGVGDTVKVHVKIKMLFVFHIKEKTNGK